MPQTLGFIGLGVMGGPMCANLAARHDGLVHAFDLVADAPEGAVRAASVAELAARRRYDLPLAPRRQAGRRSLRRNRAARRARHHRDRPLDHFGRRCPRGRRRPCRKATSAFADAPVARTRAAAIDGTLSIMVGADDALFGKIEPLLRLIGSDVTRCGAVGCGQVVKLINNTLLFEHVAALAEMFVVAERAGVAPAKLVKAVSLGSGDSFALRNHGAEGDGPAPVSGKGLPCALCAQGPWLCDRARRADGRRTAHCRGWRRNIIRRRSTPGWATGTSRRLSRWWIEGTANETRIPRSDLGACAFPKGRWRCPTARCWWSRSRAGG